MTITGGPGRRLLVSVRARATFAAALTVAGALIIAGVTLVFLVHRAGYRSVRSAARDELAAVLVLSRTAPPPSLLPVGRSTSLLQVVNREGVVVASSLTRPTVPMAHLRTPPGVRVSVVLDRLPTKDVGPFLVVAERTAHPVEGVAYVAASLKTVNDTTRTLERDVVIGGLLLVALLAALTWWLISRALRPVETIRSEVAHISEQGLGRRVPEPAANDEIGRLAHTMNDMLGRLEDAVVRQRRFVADASHELRSPLASMVAQLEVAIAHPELIPCTELLDTLRSDAGRLERVIDDLLLLARADEGLLRANHRLVDLDDIVLEEATRLRARSTVEVDTGAVSAAQVNGDTRQLRRAVRNLLDNAERHARHQVTLELHEETDQAVLAVNDDGAGIPSADRDQVFERFTRLDAARERPSGGSGLGLAIVRQIVEVHSGTVGVEDSPVGARLVVRLPLAGAASPSTPSCS